MFKNRIRLPIMFVKPQFPVERNTFRLADGSNKVLSMVIRNTYQGQTDQLPEDWHRKLVIAMAHDSVSVENERLLSNVTLDGDYGIDWQDFLQYPIAPANFQVQVTPFDATNSNCQTCEEIAQVVCVDDTTDEDWEEGTTHEFPDNVTANDSICCSPFTVTLVTFNTVYFSIVSITPDGILTATVLDPAPPGENILIATYRVTCSSGAYDEANVYGNVVGTGCPPPVNLEVIPDPTDNTIARAYWDAPTPAPVSYDWELFLASNPVTPVQTGNKLTPGTPISPLLLSGLTAGESYILSIVSNCGGSVSIAVTAEFSISSFAAPTCGAFTVTYIPYADAAPQSISYMDCAGGVHNVELTVAKELPICMLITAGSEVPIFYVASSSDISLNYTGLCTE